MKIKYMTYNHIWKEFRIRQGFHDLFNVGCMDIYSSVLLINWYPTIGRYELKIITKQV